MRNIVFFWLLFLSVTIFAQTLTVQPTNQHEESTIDSLHVTVYLWRDFQPISPPKGKPLRAKLEITADDPALLTGLRIEKVQLIHQADTVEISAADIQPLLETFPNRLRFVWRNGPYWPPNSTVDVVVFLRPKKGRPIVLNAPKQKIHATF